MSEKIGEKMAALGAQLKAADSFDERARGWMLDYIEASEARATLLYVEREEARRAQREAERAAAELEAERDKAREDFAEVSAVLRDGFERWEAEKLAFVRRIVELEGWLEAAASGPARRQPWHNPEGSPAERARAQLQDAIHHIQRDGEIGLARICATYAVEILYLQRDPCPMPRSLRDLEIVGRRLRDIIGQLDAALKMPAARVADHLRLIKLDAEKARAELRGEDWNG